MLASRSFYVSLASLKRKKILRRPGLRPRNILLLKASQFMIASGNLIRILRFLRKRSMILNGIL
jgi:hypothetical protein